MTTKTTRSTSAMARAWVTDRRMEVGRDVMALTSYTVSVPVAADPDNRLGGRPPPGPDLRGRPLADSPAPDYNGARETRAGPERPLMSETPSAATQPMVHGHRPSASDQIEATLVPESGWHFLHLYYRIDRAALGA